MHAQKKPGQLLTYSIKAAGMRLSWMFVIFSICACTKEDSVELPVLSTLSVIEIHRTSAKSGGEITHDGGAPILARGIVWGSSPGPNLDQHEGFTREGSGAGIFSSSATDLDPATIYYIRAYARNAAGTAYGNEIEFQTQSPPTVSSNPVPANSATNQPASLILQWPANTDVDGAPVTYDVYFGTSSPPEQISSSQTANSLIRTSLAFDQTYYWMVAVVDSHGNAFEGPVWNFTTMSQQGGGDIIFNPGLSYGTMTDIEGNTYRTIEIGTQTWMAENLRTTKFNDDSAIPLVTGNNTWAGLSIPAYCWYDNAPEQHAPNYGALYSWSTVETGKLCPTGWHVPSDAEWTVLADFLGGDAGGKMKETGTSHWEDPNTGATNSSGFTAVPGGVRSGHDGIFYDVSLFGNWWSSTADSNGDALYRNMYTDDAGLGRHGIIKSYGYSVRCLRD
jgi:uncharacterized protein (TIGR02145 family)